MFCAIKLQSLLQTNERTNYIYKQIIINSDINIYKHMYISAKNLFAKNCYITIWLQFVKQGYRQTVFTSKNINN